MKLKILLVVSLSIFVFSIAATTFAMTDQEKQTLIVQIQQQLVLLQQQLAVALAQEKGATPWCYTFSNDLGYANSGTNDIANLHSVLQKEGISYSPDGINAYSGGTSAAVVQFQKKYSISPQSGYVGFLTRTKLNALYGCTTTISGSPAPSNCTPKWQCNSWSYCNNGQETRSCYDLNNCKTKTNEPILTQICTKSNCNSDSNCGYSGPTGSPFCQAGNVYQIYATYVCNNPATPSSFCTGSTTDKLKTTCAINQYCKSGSCTVYSCTPSWSCTGFGACINNVQTQTCYDRNNCHDATGQPSQAKECVSCIPNWQCGSWSSCFNSQQTRYCSDSNYCGVTTNKLPTTQSCN